MSISSRWIFAGGASLCVAAAAAAQDAKPGGWTTGKPITSGSTAAPASTPVARPATAPPVSAAERPAGTPLTISIVEVRGDVQYRLEPTGLWRAATAGTALKELSELRTGMDGSIRFRVGDTQLIAVERFTTVSVQRAIRTGAGGDRAADQSARPVATTRVAVPYGRVVVDLDSTKTANDVTIEAPDVVLAAHGTTFYVNVTPGRPTVAGGVRGNTGTVLARYPRGPEVRFTGEGKTNATTPDPAALAERSTVVYPVPRGLEPDEKEVIDRASGAGDAVRIGIGVEPATLTGKTTLQSPGVTALVGKQPSGGTGNTGSPGTGNTGGAGTGNHP